MNVWEHSLQNCPNSSTLKHWSEKDNYFDNSYWHLWKGFCHHGNLLLPQEDEYYTALHTSWNVQSGHGWPWMFQHLQKIHYHSYFLSSLAFSWIIKLGSTLHYWALNACPVLSIIISLPFTMHVALPGIRFSIANRGLHPIINSVNGH